LLTAIVQDFSKLVSESLTVASVSPVRPMNYLLKYFREENIERKLESLHSKVNEKIKTFKHRDLADRAITLLVVNQFPRDSSTKNAIGNDTTLQEHSLFNHVYGVTVLELSPPVFHLFNSCKFDRIDHGF